MSPDKFTLSEKMVEVGNGHKLYAQLWGNPNGVPVVFLHGGPGSGCSDSHRTQFDPSYHQVLFFDQRGAGNSTPHGSLKNNTTEDLIEDIDKLSEEFGFQRFVITGGSWGSCLAFVYAIRYPERVSSMVLRGIFTGRRSEIEFLDRGLFQAFFPDVWDDFVRSVPDEARTNPSKYHQARIFGDNKLTSKESAYEYMKLESSLVSLDDRQRLPTLDEFDPAGITIEIHYLVNNCFLKGNYILENANKLTMPVYLVQGRYDTVCPPSTAYELSKALPNGRLIWTTAGHSGSDRANWDVVKTLLRERQA